MSLRPLLHVIGVVVAAVGAAMLLAALVALGNREWDDAWQIALAAVVTAAAGLGARKVFPAPGTLSVRQGFAIVGLSWFAISAFGTLPFLFPGAIGNLTDAFFETTAGFTTTGASIVPDPGALGHGILIWRALTQWLGGMGVIVLSIAVLPLLGVGGVQLARAEAPGPAPDRLTPRFRETAKRLWLVYAVFTAVQVLLLTLGEMTVFEATAHAFATMSTGGFSTDVESLGGYSAYSQWVVTLFMILAGTSFALHYRALRRPGAYLESAELRLYLTILVGASAVAAIGTWSAPVGDAIRDAVFTVVSLVTTTGFATVDYVEWVAALQILVMGLFFIGGMSGSTAGAVKPYRLGVLTSASRNDVRRLIHPRGVFVTRLGKEPVPDHIVESVQSFFLLYMFIFMTGTLLMGVIESGLGIGLDLVTSASAVASSLGNVGPGLGAVGPTSNYLVVPALGKWLLSLLMIVGRLEIFPVLLLFTPELWRR
jgi:trk system potassium uptake protein TrkH